jgi:hypothetical protein
MTTQNPFEKAPKALKPEQDDAALKAPAVEKRELTDDEIAAIAGGVSVSFSNLSGIKH